MKQILVLLCVLIATTMVSCGGKTNRKNLTYNEVLEVCCEAINKNNANKIDSFIYDGFGDQWNEENIIEPLSNFEDENLPLENKISDFEIYESNNDLKKWENYIFEKTNKIVELDKAIEIEMDNDSSMEISLVMIDEKWYILYFDL